MRTLGLNRGNQLLFFRREELRSKWSLETALAQLRPYRNDAAAHALLRQLLMRGRSGTDVARLSVDELLACVAREMVSGEIVVAVPATRAENLKLMADPAPAPAQPKPKAKPKDVPEDEPTFDSGHDAAAQAAVLVAAAQAGIPFCEECARAARENAA